MSSDVRRRDAIHGNNNVKPPACTGLGRYRAAAGAIAKTNQTNLNVKLNDAKTVQYAKSMTIGPTYMIVVSLQVMPSIDCQSQANCAPVKDWFAYRSKKTTCALKLKPAPTTASAVPPAVGPCKGVIDMMLGGCSNVERLK